MILQTLQAGIMRTVVKFLPCDRKIICYVKTKKNMGSRKLTVVESVVNIIGVRARKIESNKNPFLSQKKTKSCPSDSIRTRNPNWQVHY